MKYLALISIIFCWLSPFQTIAKVPKNPAPWEHWEENKKLNNIYDQTVDILLSSGYDRSVNGLKVGFIKTDFELSKNRSLSVMPVINRTGDDSESNGIFYHPNSR
jgi:hypothetical protein